MSDTCTYLIEENAFIREGLKSLLSKSGYFPIIESKNIEELKSTTERKSSTLAIIGIDNLSTGTITSTIKTMKSWFSETRILLLSSYLEKRLITANFLSEVDGYLLKDISAEAFLSSLNLVMLGEKVFPTALVTFLPKEGNTPTPQNNIRETASPHNHCSHNLSEREIEIIQHLENGEPNKIIARQLDITESTVKVHLKAILRKLRLENRTQVAIWAINNNAHPSLTSKM